MRRRYALIGAILAVLAGGIIFGLLLPPVLSMAKVSDWSPTPCYIRSSKVTPVDNKRSRFEVEYVYRVGGQEYVQTTVLPGYQGDLAAQTGLLAERFPREAQTTCYVNPDNPAQAILEKPTNRMAAYLGPPATLALAGLFALGYLLRRRAPQPG